MTITLRTRDFMLTSGSVPRLEACPAARVFEGHDDEGMKPWMWYGIGVHKFLEKLQTDGHQAALDYIGKKFRRCLPTCEAIDPNTVPKGEVEIAYAHDVHQKTARRLEGWNIDKSQEAYGRVDLELGPEATTTGNRMVVDWKSGAPSADKTPVGNAQLLGLACSVMRYHDVDQVDGAIVAVPSDGQLVWTTTTYARDELHEFEDRQRRVHLAMVETRRAYRDGTVPEAQEGQHCTYCSVEAFCPAKGGPELPVGL